MGNGKDEAPELRRDSPLAPDVAPVLARHLAMMRAASPPESVHALPADALAGPDVAFYSLRAGGQVLAIGAIRRIAPGHHEIKSMHVVAEARGRGLSRRMLGHLIAAARADGARRISLETGIEDAFIPARALYAAAGFAPCGPFGDYGPDPHSVFMTRALD
ncbi:GNAT family N-acetyltransferase [Ruixingdingia sedimenti]|uniref:GNAT family N-acetyltransferase n=1 Tax=Ruixingdingia sedimenti TaxID=3073604 RepID=A0ABU1F2F0_9RHOB|nr:GNAT family N-acetyltransferase [Xinfangfangia sp. LG-4]MDR5651034.1 GNAT family N-acetyltransferase [Xinfangfangia sp. LG-4]